MSSSDEGASSAGTSSTAHPDHHFCQTKKKKKYRGVRRRKWGKWVSEIRVPGTQDRLWLGSYSAPEAAAVAHDIATYCLRGGPASSLEHLNFPDLSLPAGVVGTGLSPQSVQKAASDAGMAIDAQFAIMNNRSSSISSSIQQYCCPTTVLLQVQQNQDSSSSSSSKSKVVVLEDHVGTPNYVALASGAVESRKGDLALNISVDDYL